MNPNDSPVVRTLLIATVVILGALELRQSRRQRPEASLADRGSRSVIRLSLLVAYAAAFITRKFMPSATIGSEILASSIGLVLMWCGISLRLWSFQTLGHYFTFIVQTSPDQRVISTGPYRMVRHPSYAGIVLVLIGLGFMIANWASLVVLVVISLCGLVYRIIVEERALLRDLGGRYQSYARGRKRLIPFIW